MKIKTQMENKLGKRDDERLELEEKLRLLEEQSYNQSALLQELK